MVRNARGGTSVVTVPDGGRPPTPADRLLLVAGGGFFATFDLEGRELLVGRAPECQVRIDHSALSRRHAVVRGATPATVEDVGSTNGTRIAGVVRRGGERVELAVGDSFQIGPFSFLVVSRGAAILERSMSGRDVLRVTDPTIQGVPSLVADVAATRANVLVLGETGVGKEVLAETVHELSGRAGPLTRINCAALSESLLESELFGHEKGAFTGAAAPKTGLLEAAHGGTVFLDEVGELPLAMQAKLLRAVERREVLRVGATRPREVDVRFIAATNRNLVAEVDAGRFRRDLFFRLDEVTLVIPPLRERRGMIGPLALHFAQEAGQRMREVPRLGADVIAALEAHPWPGNVRELRAVIGRAALVARGGEISRRHLMLAQPPAEIPPAAPTPPSPPATAAPDLADDERADRDRVLEALDACAGNQTRAARRLGIGRTTLLKKLAQYRIKRPRK